MMVQSLFEPWIMVPILGILGVSLSLIGSTAPALFSNQLIYFIAGFVLYLSISSIDYRIWSKFSKLFYIVSFIFLLTSFFGPQVRGSNRWIDIGFTRLQPSELIKPFIIVVLADFITKSKRNLVSSLIKPFLIFMPFLLFIFKQPDLGNVLVYLFSFIAIEITNGLSFFYLASITLLTGLMVPLFWFILKDYQKTRILSFLNPHTDPAGTGYNALQAIIAIGSGQIFGLGLGKGTQSHLLFLPEYHTDFVFASLGEELGFLGAAAVILFYFILLSRILYIAFRTDNKFGKAICMGGFSQIFIQVFINIGMNLGVLPITGITLPLLSFGGSSILSTFITLGLIQSVNMENRERSPIVIK